MRPFQQGVASGLKTIFRNFVGFLARFRALYAAISGVLLAIPSFWLINLSWQKWVLFGFGVFFLVLSILLERVVRTAQLSDLSRLNNFAEIHAGCIDLIQEGEHALRVENNLHKAKSKIEEAQKGLLQLFADSSVYLCNLEQGTSTANLMIPTSSDNLKVVKVSVRRAGRTEGERKLQIAVSIPGAPKAFVTRKIQYIPDTHKFDTDTFDHERPYRSILSFPVEALIYKEGCLAVVNIDNNEINAFKNHKLIYAVSRDWVSSLALTVSLYAAIQINFATQRAAERAERG